MKKETEKLPVELKAWVAPSISTIQSAKYTLAGGSNTGDGVGTFKS